MDELRTDLEELLGDGDLVMSTVDVIAARLAELGYVKVVRCVECKWAWRCPCDACRGNGQLMCTNPENVNPETGLGKDVKQADYCSAGEKKEGTDGTASRA